jgi:hypothetical protein
MKKILIVIIIALVILLIYNYCTKNELFTSVGPLVKNKYLKLSDGNDTYYLSSYYQLTEQVKKYILEYIQNPNSEINKQLFNMEAEKNMIKDSVKNLRPIDIVFATKAITNDNGLELNLTHQRGIVGFNSKTNLPIYYSLDTRFIEEPFVSTKTPVLPNEITNFYTWENPNKTNILTISNIKGINMDGEILKTHESENKINESANTNLLKPFEINNLLTNNHKIYLKKIPIEGISSVNPIYMVIILDKSNDMYDSDIIKNITVSVEDIDVKK